MHVQTHILSGWCLANVFPLTPRQRFCCMVAAAVPDLDGAGIVVDWITQSHETTNFWYFHHIVGHNLLVGVVVALALAAWSSRWLWAFPLYLGLFHLHLLMDYYGSGEGWGIAYGWPFSRHEYVSTDFWALYSWQNFLAFGIVFAWTLLIVLFQRRTPLELILPRLDRQLVGWLRQVLPAKRPQAVTPAGRTPD